MQRERNVSRVPHPVQPPSSPRYLAALLLAVAVCLPASAQTSSQPKSQSVDLAVTFVAQRSLRTNTGQNFWSQGGSVTLGANVWRGWGLAADITGTHTAFIGSSNSALSLITATFGLRYRWHDGHRLSLYGQALAGEANAFHSLFPAPGVAITSAHSLAFQTGGGMDYRLSPHLALRPIDAAWLRTQLPNATNNVQNNLRLSAGAVLRF
jgi:hypothetical protein